MSDEETVINGKLIKEMKVAELKKACKERNLPVNGTKAIILKRLKAAVELEDLKKSALKSEGAVQPNSDIGDDSTENDFVKQYLENQRKLLQKQHHRFSSASEAESEDDAPKRRKPSLNSPLSPTLPEVTSPTEECTVTKVKPPERRSRPKRGAAKEAEKIPDITHDSKKKVITDGATYKAKLTTAEKADQADTDNSNIKANQPAVVLSKIPDKKDVVITAPIVEKSKTKSLPQEVAEKETSIDISEEKVVADAVPFVEESETTSGDKKDDEIDSKNPDDFSQEKDVVDAVPFVEESETTSMTEKDEKDSKGPKDDISQEEDVVDAVPFVEESETTLEDKKAKKENKEVDGHDEVDSAPPIEETDPVSESNKMVDEENANAADEITVTVEEEQMEIDSPKSAKSDHEPCNGKQTNESQESEVKEQLKTVGKGIEDDRKSEKNSKEMEEDITEEDSVDVGGVPVISMDADLMEEVEELDYDEGDPDKPEQTPDEIETEEYTEKVSFKKKRKHREKHEHAGEDVRQPKKQRKLKRSSVSDAAQKPSEKVDTIESVEKSEESLSNVSESTSAEPASQPDDQQQVAAEQLEKKEEKATTVKRRISIKKNPLKRSLVAEQPREKKRKWGKAAASDSSQINISTDYLKNIIDVKKGAIEEEVADLEDYPAKDEQINDKTQGESEEEGEIVEEVIVEEEVREEHEEPMEEEKGLMRDTRKVVSSDDVRVKEAEEQNKRERAKERRNSHKQTESTSIRQAVIKKSDDSEHRAVSPPRMPASCILHISNLVRPFALSQLKQLLNEHGSFIPDSFWINNIKSHCFVKYENDEVASATRNALHRMQWPVSSPKRLVAEYSTQEEVDWNKSEQPAQAKKPLKRKKTEPERPKEADLVKSARKERDSKHAETEEKRERNERDARVEKPGRNEKDVRVGREGERSAERNRRHGEGRKEHGSNHRREEDRDGRGRRSLREWDMHKLDQDEEVRRQQKRDEQKRDEQRREERAASEHRRRRQEEAPKPPAEPPKLLDDLFRKTEATPCIYWLPLTEEQVFERDKEREKKKNERPKLRREDDGPPEARRQEERPRREERPPRRDESKDNEREERRREERNRNEGRMDRRDDDQSRRRRNDVIGQRSREDLRRREERPEHRREPDISKAASDKRPRQVRRRKTTSTSSSSDSSGSDSSSGSSSSSSSSSDSEA